jgi:asparagine synthase (glutamine-hydrolysing)
MPGISGIISTGSTEDRTHALQDMVKCMMHETSYTCGTYANEGLGLWIGWVAHKGSFTDCMPIWNETKDVCLIFSGEDFTDPYEIIRLRTRGHACDPGNAGYLVHLYEEMGCRFIETLNGWFSGVLVDLPRKSVVVFNDRYGIDRVFLHEGKDGLYFSSGAKALLAVLPEAREFDPKALGEFLTCGCTLGSRSLYKGIHVLPPGALWTAEHGEIKKGSYFDLREWVGQQHFDEKQFATQVLDLFGGMVTKYSGGPFSVGVSLTGGLDSRMIAACLDVRPGEFPCYTFGSMYRDTFDVQVARQVAKACRQPHHVLVLGEEFLHEFPHYLEKAVYISDGYTGLSGAAELYVNSLARNLAPVRLTGNYGGELLRGVRAFKYRVPEGAFVNSDTEPYVLEARTTFQEQENSDAVTFALFYQAPLQGYGRRAIERSQIVLRTPFMDNNLVKLVYQAPPHLLRGAQLASAIISRYNPTLLKIPTDRGMLGDGSRLEGIIRRLCRGALIKAEYLANHGTPNWLAAITHFGLGGILERSFLGRDKFQHFRLWSRKRFSSYITGVLLEGGGDLEQFFDRRHIERMVREHVAGRQNYTDEIDKIMTLALACRVLLKGASFDGS